MRYAFALLGFAASLAHASDAEIRYYDVSGATAEELRREINARGPIGKRGTRVDGFTKWHVSWKYKYSPQGGGCQFTRIEVSVTGSIDLPRWTELENASAALAGKWRRYFEALRRHEYGHFENGRKAAEEIEMLGRSFRVAESCSTIGQAFKDQAHLIVEKYNREDREYDSRTRHGRTEGVRFP